MAKSSSIVKNDRRREMAAKGEPKRAALRKELLNPELDEQSRLALQKKLQKMPRDTSRIRIRNRCVLTGRSRGVYADFRLCRIKFRELAHRGLIPGVTKASW